MLYEKFDPPFLEIPTGRIWYRCQLTRARTDSIRIKGLNLPPANLAHGRFDTPGHATAYLADSVLTAMYETSFRREAMSRPLADLVKRSIVSFRIAERLRLVDVSELAESYPVLQSLRYAQTQELAGLWKQAGLDGVIYASAQHAGHLGICLFEQALPKVQRVEAVPLVERGTMRLHKLVVEASRRAGVPIVAA